MAEQEVRSQQLSIVEIARLWSAETGDSAEDIERELAEWAYAASADGAQVGSKASSNKIGPAKLKIEPDPRREICREDLDAFCRENDRLLPHIWPETTPPLEAVSPATAPAASKPESADPTCSPRDISRLVVRAMDRMGSTAQTPGSRRAPCKSDPVAPAATPTATSIKSATTRQSEKSSAPVPAKNRKAASAEDLDGPKRKTSTKPAHAVKAIRAAKKAPAASNAPAQAKDARLGPLHDIASRAHDVPVKVMAPPPVFAARPDRPASVSLPMIAAAGIIGGALIVAAGGAAWLEFSGPGLGPFLLGERAAQAELSTAAQRIADLSGRSEVSDRENQRLTGELEDARRQNDTLRARIEDISSLGPRLTDTQKANTELRRTVGGLTAALDAARSGGSAAVQAIEKELKSIRDALDKANAAANTARKEADRLTESLATAQGEIEASMLARRRVEQERDAGVRSLAKANNEIENLVQSGTAAQAVVQRLETELITSKQQLQAREKDRVKLEAQLATLNTELTETRARTVQLAAAETESRRLGADLDAATLEIARLRTAAESSRRETANLASRLDKERRTTGQVRTEVKTATKKNQDLAKELALARTASAELRAEAKDLDIQAAQLSEFLATAREDSKALKTDRAAAISKADDLERDLASLKDEASKLRASIEGANSTSAQLANRLNKELEAAKQLAAREGVARGTAQNRVESLVVNMATAQAEILTLRAKIRQAEARVSPANLAASKERSALTAVSDLRLRAAPPKEDLIGVAAVSSSSDRKLDADTRATVSEPPKTAKLNEAAKLMLARGDEYLGRGDIASARLFFEQAAKQGDASALSAIGRTYDPRILSGLGVLGSFANPAIATLWYERAMSAGDEHASGHLAALRAWRAP